MAMLIPLSGPRGAGKFVLVDDADYEVCVRYRWHLDRDGYVRGSRGPVRYQRMHRWLMGVSDPKVFVDHANGDLLDCRRENLRESTRGESNRNRGSWGASGRKGVFWSRRSSKWQAQVKFNHRRYHVGLFDDLDEAARARDRKAVELHGAFVRLNFQGGV